jgi:uncharacterized OB-fold protein
LDTPTPEYPRPARTSANAPLLDAWQQGKLLLPQCAECDRKFFFPRELCPHCWSPRIDWVASPGRGKIVSFSRIHRQIHPSFANETPTILAEIALDDGWTMIARVITADPQSIASGMRVVPVAMPQAARYPLPTFSPEP